MNIQDAIVYDIECFPNVFTFNAYSLFDDWESTWEISEFRDDRQALFQFFWYCHQNHIPMIGFRNVPYDYPVIHFLYHKPNATYPEIYAKSYSIINSDDQFEHTIWDNQFFAPQIDLSSINHFDNNAKRTSLKALEINMRSQNVIDMPLTVETFLTQDQTNCILVPYNKHDTSETKKFAHFCMPAIKFRISMIDQLGRECVNYNDSKIGSKLLEMRLGDAICYDRSTGRKVKRQTVRSVIFLNEIIFPYVRFNNPEFQRILDFMRAQVLKPSDMVVEMSNVKVSTKGVFKGLKAIVEGVEYKFGTGGIHGSVSNQKITAQGDWIIRDIDVKSLYPNIAIQNGLYPEHLGQRFIEEYAKLPKERAEWQKKKGKKCPEANSMKLASNGTYGNSNSPYSIFFDTQFTMTITINGQLMLAMLIEKMILVPTLKIIQANTDGISYFIHRDYEHMVVQICREWEQLTKLSLEGVEYSRMFIADVNNYIAEETDGTLKQKGRYWHPDPLDHFNSISQSQPPAWHKDLGNIVSIRAAVASMVKGIDIETYIKLHSDPFDFMLRYKCQKRDNLYVGELKVQNTTRYFMSRAGGKMLKISPARGPEGQFKKANNVSQTEYDNIMLQTGGQWDERVCTKNKSRYASVSTGVQTGYLVTECNDASDFDWSNINYDWYVTEARKLLI